MSSAKYLPLLARSPHRAAAGGHARVPPICLSRSAAASAIIPPVLLARDPLFYPPRRSRVSRPALLCWVNRARCSTVLNSQRRAPRQSQNREPVSISPDPLYTSFFFLLYSHVSPRSCVTSTPTHACSTPRTHCRLPPFHAPSSSQLFRHECALGMIQSMLT